MAELNPKWDEYILWLATPEHERGLVATEEAWAKSNGFADARTMRRWRKNPLFLERQQKLINGIVVKTGAVKVYDTEQGAVDADELDYKVVKQKLVESAKTGNLKAQELYMKTYGKTWVEDEQASRASDFSNIELQELITKAITVLDENSLISFLTEKGYTISKENNNG